MKYTKVDVLNKERQKGLNMQMKRPALKKIALELCTCTWIEILTGAGITLYVLFGLHDLRLAVLTIGLFAPLIAFHFAVSSLLPRRKNILRIKSIPRNQ
ncbi:MAG: hypothetical protein M3M91_03995 [Thermoproteota archaeon]|jgi:hypothetical protein|nr:hypothetical protein [Thermoproteota archaeon]